MFSLYTLSLRTILNLNEITITLVLAIFEPTILTKNDKPDFVWSSRKR